MWFMNALHKQCVHRCRTREAASTRRAALEQLLSTISGQTTGLVFTRRRSWSYAEYWKHFVAHLNDVHAFGYNSTGNERIWMKFGALRVLSGAGPDRFWARSAQKRERLPSLFFLSGKQLPVGQISRNLQTIRGSARWWILSERNFQNLPARGRFFLQKPTSFRTTPTLSADNSLTI